MSEVACVETVGEEQVEGARCESPPVAGQPVKEEVDPRVRLHQLANELVRSHNRRLVVEYLRLRRAIR
jgi:hypothetical protein